ncbi:MAG: hypothetical protein ACE5HZ_03795 [Fidelibacterota bacterium]
MNTFIEQIESLGPRVVTAVVVFMVFWIGGVLTQKVVRRLGSQKDLDEQFLGLVS